MTELTVPVTAPLTVADEIAALPSATLALVAPFNAREVTVASGWVTAAQQTSAARLWTRHGTSKGGADVFRFDYGSPSAQTLLADSVYQSFADLEFSGFSLGSVLGGHGEMGYDPPATVAGHVPHGGDYRTKGIRAFLGNLPAGARITDGVQEHLADEVDLAQDSDGLYPGHLELAEETVRSLGVLDMPNEARHMSPGLWPIAYGERSQTGRLMPPLTTVGQAASLYHPYGDGQWPGLTDTQWNQLFTWQLATQAIHGQVPLLQMTARRFIDRLRPDTNAAAVGFVATVFDALTDTDWCAKFLAYGRSELPLRTGREVNSECNHECGASPDTQTNPVYYVRQISPVVVQDAIPPLVGQFHTGAECNSECSNECSRSPATTTAGWGAAHQSFPVRSVLSGMFRDRITGDLCLVLINWTASAAFWSGWFAPWLYRSFGGEVSLECSTECDQVNAYDVERLNADGTATSLATDVADATLLACSGISGTLSGRTLSLGSVPAYSVQAYRLSLAG